METEEACVVGGLGEHREAAQRRNIPADIFPETKPVSTVGLPPEECETPHLSAQLPSVEWKDTSDAMSGITPGGAGPEEVRPPGDSEKTNLPKYTGLIRDFN